MVRPQTLLTNYAVTWLILPPPPICLRLINHVKKHSKPTDLEGLEDGLVIVGSAGHLASEQGHHLRHAGSSNQSIKLSEPTFCRPIPEQIV